MQESHLSFVICFHSATYLCSFMSSPAPYVSLNGRHPSVQLQGAMELRCQWMSR